MDPAGEVLLPSQNNLTVTVTNQRKQTKYQKRESGTLSTLQHVHILIQKMLPQNVSSCWGRLKGKNVVTIVVSLLSTNHVPFVILDAQRCTRTKIWPTWLSRHACNASKQSRFLVRFTYLTTRRRFVCLPAR